MPDDSKGQGQGQGDSSDPDGSSAAGALPLIDPKRVIYGQCLDWLAQASGKPRQDMRSLLGKWVRDYQAFAVIEAFQIASRDPPAGDPVEYLVKVLAHRAKPETHRRGEPVPVTGNDGQWIVRLKRFRADGTWHEDIFGPKPGEPGCRVPAHILQQEAA